MKTLKKINLDECPEGDESLKVSCSAELKNKIKQEAIEHYKAYLGEWEEHKEFSWVERDKAIADWIKYFFNITDEDLK